MAELDPHHLALVIGKTEPSVFRDYVEIVANDGLLPYREILQYGAKAGESLYSHVIDGVFVLEQLRPTLHLTDVEARVLFTAFTIHDLNKVPGYEGQAYGRLMTPGAAAQEIERLRLDEFFPEYTTYLEDIVALCRAHSAHYHVDGAGLLADHDPYGLDRGRVDALKHLMRAADVVTLSQTLGERRQKEAFLFHLNAYGDAQYAFCTHQVTEDRGLLTNIVNDCVVTYLRDELGLIPLLFYPDGVAYVHVKGRPPTIRDADTARLGEQIAAQLSKMTSTNLEDFIESKPGGVKVMPKCLELGLPFSEIWHVVYGKVQSRNMDVEGIAERARERALRDFEKAAAAHPEVAEAVRAQLEDEATPVTAMDESQLRLGELARAYYLFVKEFCAEQLGTEDAWTYVYRLLDLPRARWPIYAYFNATWYRAYALARDIPLSAEALMARLVADGTRLLAEQGISDPKVPLFTDYVRRYVLFSFAAPRKADFSAHVQHYVDNQHKQCVMCSSTLPTSPWMAGDVRDDITVQVFSNRLRGGPGDPKKQICPLCRLQFLLEKLNYPPVRNEDLIYLHLFPYAFTTAPFIAGLRVGIERLRREDLVTHALFLHTNDGIEALRAREPLKLDFAAVTKAGKAQVYGLYLPRYSATVSNHIVFPINPPGANATERFLFALWNAMLLQRAFGLKVLLTDAPVAPLGKEAFHDLYVANAPLAARGLLRTDDYAAYRDGSQAPGTLASLWTEVEALFGLYRLTRNPDTRANELVTLVRAMGESPLALFYTIEKLLESRVSDREWGMIRSMQDALPDTQTLAFSLGGEWMATLSTALTKLAEIAWQGGLRGRSLRKNSLMMALDEVFGKLALQSQTVDLAVLRAATVEDIFEHLERITDRQYSPGKRKWAATEAFVDHFYDEVLGGVYGGNLRKLLADEKLIRSAYMFYIRAQIKPGEAADEGGADDAAS